MGLLAALSLPMSGQAAPPKLGDLPAPDELPELEPEPEAEREPSEPEPSPAESKTRPEATPAFDASPPSEPEPSPATEVEDKGASEDDTPRPEVKTLAKAKWIKHVIIPGERLDEIATRYNVRKDSLIRWNKLDKKKPRIYAGRKLAVYTKHIPPPQQKLIYTVQYGDTWNKIAKAHHVDPDHLRLRWNSKVPRKFKAGQEIVIWVDPLNDPRLLDGSQDKRSKAAGGTSTSGRSGSTSGTAPAALPMVAIPTGSISVGKPNRGKISNSIELPDNKALYTKRKPTESYGSSHTLHNLQLAIANFRQATGYTGDLVIGAISKKGGGRLRPHSSHQSGRDVDIRLPLKRKGGNADNMDDVDWDATWGLIQALVATGEIQYIFLTTDRQKRLYKAAKNAGASKDMLERLIQYPNKKGTNNGIVRHEAGHTAHIHVRFTCGANETRCESY